MNQNLKCKRVGGKTTNKKYFNFNKPKEDLKMRMRSQEI